MPTLSAQFTAVSQDLSIRKGSSAKFSFEVTNSASTANVVIPGTLNLQDCCIFSEVRRKAASAIVDNLAGTVRTGKGEILLSRDAVKNRAASLADIPLYSGDLISLEGALDKVKVNAIAYDRISTTGEATRDLDGGRIWLVKPRVETSFTPSPNGATKVIVAETVFADDTTIAIAPLTVSIASGKTLYFAYRNDDYDWQYVGSATLSATANINDATLNISSLKFALNQNSIPENAIAFSSASSISKCDLILDALDTENMAIGTYGYSVSVMDTTGFVTTVLEGNLTIVDNRSNI